MFFYSFINQYNKKHNKTSFSIIYFFYTCFYCYNIKKVTYEKNTINTKICNFNDLYGE